MAYRYILTEPIRVPFSKKWAPSRAPLTGPVRSRFSLVRQTMLQETIWAQALSSAIDEYLSKKTGGQPAAVPAAPLKPLIRRHAEQLGLVFPPEGYERIKFVDFLDLFPAVLSTHRRPGQDALVAKAQNVELLDKAAAVEASSTSANRTLRTLRDDVFKAFTLPPEQGHLHWYASEQGKFVQAAVGEANWIAGPSSSMATGIQDRRAFAEDQVNTDNRDTLLDALNEQTPFAAFSEAIKSLCLGRAWHAFRLKCVVDRVTAWSSTNGIPWDKTWEFDKASPPPQLGDVSARETNAFLSGLMQLGPEDAKRVMVPLDIVLRLLRRD